MGFEAEFGKKLNICAKAWGYCETKIKMVLCGKIIECVKQNKYFGLFFTTTLSWSLAKRTLAAQENKALGMF